MDQEPIGRNIGFQMTEGTLLLLVINEDEAAAELVSLVSWTEANSDQAQVRFVRTDVVVSASVLNELYLPTQQNVERQILRGWKGLAGHPRFYADTPRSSGPGKFPSGSGDTSD